MFRRKQALALSLWGLVGIASFPPAEAFIKVKCHGLKCRGTSNIPKPLENLVKGTDNTIKRNTKVLSNAGRAVGCLYTGCASEAYIKLKTDEALQQAERDIQEFSERARAEAEKKGRDELIAYLNREIEASRSLRDHHQALADASELSKDSLEEMKILAKIEWEERQRMGRAAALGRPSERLGPDLVRRFYDQEVRRSWEGDFAEEREAFEIALKARAAELGISLEEIYPELIQALSTRHLSFLIESWEGLIKAEMAELAAAQSQVTKYQTKIQTATDSLNQISAQMADERQAEERKRTENTIRSERPRRPWDSWMY